MHDFKKLEVWKEAVSFVIKIYKVTGKFPDFEKYGLGQQLNRASVSISSNIAEGAGRAFPKEFAMFLSIAYGSTCEVETQLFIARELSYFSDEIYMELSASLSQIQKRIYNLKLKVSQVK
ncbi:MAG: four helix bundle protein [Sphingobacteriales bacterium]|nr:MAG: four helix bundle protein [Sphingobacteriales bacterium]